jgi:hypothetical protein
VQDRRVQVAYVHGIAHGVVAELVGFAKCERAFHAAARTSHGEAPRVVVATVAILRNRQAAKLAAPHDQRRVEQSAPSQIKSIREADAAGADGLAARIDARGLSAEFRCAIT